MYVFLCILYTWLFARCSFTSTTLQIIASYFISARLFASALDEAIEPAFVSLDGRNEDRAIARRNV